MKTSISRWLKIIFATICDLFFIAIGYSGAYWLRFQESINMERLQGLLYSFPYIAITSIAVFSLCGLYRVRWEHAGYRELLEIPTAVTLSSVAAMIVGVAIGHFFPLSIYFMSWAIIMIFLAGSRLFSNFLEHVDFRQLFWSRKKGVRTMIIGAGKMGSTVIREMRSADVPYNPVVVIDDNPGTHFSYLNGVAIRGGREQIPSVAKEFNVQEIIFAIPSAPADEKQRILNICAKTGCKLKTMPSIAALIASESKLSFIRDVDISDLLGRREIRLDTEKICFNFENKTILVTGGGGSIGSELCRQIAAYHPARIIILDNYENTTYEVQNELLSSFGEKLDLKVIIGSVCDRKKVERIFEAYRPDIVFHAAARKHVPLMEISPEEAINNNIFGTINVAECSDKYHTGNFVLISTDKAVNPTSIMGATKRVCEKYIQHMSHISNTNFAAVRFGNVLGSNGSVIPIFKNQIANGGPVCVTHPEITRYFMTIPEAVSLVVQASVMAKGGEIFILDMGEPVKIYDLACNLIRLSGLEPHIDIKIHFCGLRSGEKLYEELMLESESEAEDTPHSMIKAVCPKSIDGEALLKNLELLQQTVQADKLDYAALNDNIRRLVPNFIHE